MRILGSSGSSAAISSPNEPTVSESVPESKPAAGYAACGAAELASAVDGAKGRLSAATVAEGPIPPQLDPAPVP
eukprot:3597281-Pyramimonas_sp.AAC.1